MLPRFKVEMKITICEGEFDNSNYLKKYGERSKDVAPKEIKFSKNERSFAESLKLFRELIKKWVYGPHKSARALIGPTFTPKCFIANWMKECLATEYTSIDQIRESIDKAVNN